MLTSALVPTALSQISNSTRAQWEFYAFNLGQDDNSLFCNSEFFKIPCNYREFSKIHCNSRIIKNSHENKKKTTEIARNSGLCREFQSNSLVPRKFFTKNVLGPCGAWEFFMKNSIGSRELRVEITSKNPNF